VKEIPDASENAQYTACASLVSYAVTEVEPNIQTLSVPTLQSLSSKENMIISSLEFSAITGSDSDSSSVVKPVKNRGRPTKTSAAKTEAPKSEAQVRRCTRLHNEGYKQLQLPDYAPRKKKASVAKAADPAILQIEELQRIGVELCHIDPEELTEEQLMRARKEE
jgi:hypothetical protein